MALPDYVAMVALMADVRRTVDRRGVMVLGVLGDAQDPPYAYTIGLHDRIGHEYIVVGMPGALAAIVLNELYENLISKGVVPPLDEPVEGVLRGHPAYFRECGLDITSTHGGVAVQFHQSVDVRFRQLVYPDRGGRFPFEAGYDWHNMGPRQHLLYLMG